VLTVGWSARPLATGPALPPKRFKKYRYVTLFLAAEFLKLKYDNGTGNSIDLTLYAFHMPVAVPYGVRLYSFILNKIIKLYCTR
jgi:hypothetical protein